jgi:hypothetical protein
MFMNACFMGLHYISCEILSSTILQNITLYCGNIKETPPLFLPAVLLGAGLAHYCLSPLTILSAGRLLRSGHSAQDFSRYSEPDTKKSVTVHCGVNLVDRKEFGLQIDSKLFLDTWSGHNGLTVKVGTP